MSKDSFSNPSSHSHEIDPAGDGLRYSDTRPPVREDEQTVISRPTVGTTRRQTVSLPAAKVGQALEGVQLGHFLLQEFVGGGGMGAVFRGLDTTLDRVVAVKVVSSRNTDEDTLRRFENEAQSAARLDHPNIARVYYVGDDQGWNFIVFEFIDGVNLRDLVAQRGPLSVSEAVRYTLQIADALAHASARDVVHRDIKPSNILVTSKGVAKLVDMGLARLHAQADAPADDLTATGVTLGTFDYISPEQARDPRSADVRSDLYSLGCTLYFMLTGLPPFPEGTVLQKLLSHSGDRPPDMRDLRPGLGDEIEAVTAKLMAKQPAQRYQTPRELVADLMALADQLDLKGIAQPQYTALPTDVARTGFAWHLPWMISLGLLILAGTIMYVAWRPSSSVSGDGPGRPRLAASGVRGAPSVPGPPVLPGPVSDPVENELDVPQATGVEPAFTPGDATETDDARQGSGGQVAPFASRPEPDDLAAEANGSGRTATGATELATEPASAVTTTLVVGSAFDQRPVAGELFVPSLKEALEKLHELPDVDTIELRFEEREEPPLTVDLRRTLTIRAGPGYRPQIVFRPAGETALSPWRMVKLLGNHRVSFEGLHWRLELPYEQSSALRCSLFHLNQIDQVSLADCSLTIRNEFDARASFFSIQAPRAPAAVVGQNELEQPRSPSIEIQRTIARGPATLVRAEEGLPFWLTWEQGLFTSTERMVELRGLPEYSRSDVVRLDLTNVTASMEQGLCRVVIDDTGPFLPAVDIQCRNCVLTHLAGQPLVEHIGVSSLAEAQEKFRYGGQDNCYEATDIRWRVRVEDNQEFQFAWTDREGGWYEESFADSFVRWSDAYRSKHPTISAQTPRDFLLDASQSRIAGFDESVLPLLPDAAGLPTSAAPDSR